jgi:uncharacterized protein YbjT (DUF2867 family)
LGGTGKVGGEVVKELQKRKAEIRLLVRKDDTPAPQGAEVATAELLDPVSVEKALRGVDKLYLLNAVAPDELTQGLIAYDLAKKLKLNHIVGDAGISVVDIRDIAEATAIVLTSDEHEGKTYNLNGPEALSGTKAASIWSKLLGKEIRYGGHNMDAFEEQMRNSAPSWSAFDIRMMFQGYLERGFVAETGDVEKLTKLLGHAPRRYEDFAAETVALWKS